MNFSAIKNSKRPDCGNVVFFNTEVTEESQSAQRRMRRRFAPFVERFGWLAAIAEDKHGRSVSSVTPLCSLCLKKTYATDSAFPDRAKLHQPVAVQAHG